MTRQENLGLLALNCGSSSLKFSFYLANGPRLSLIAEGAAEEIGRSRSRFSFRVHDGGSVSREEKVAIRNHKAATRLALDALQDASTPKPLAIGHRFVHGGPHVREHQKLTPAVLNNLEAAAQFAPLHVPPAMAALRATQEKWPETMQVICLDTAFHRTLLDVSKTLALPASVREGGVERYGFHGLSLESIVAQLNPLPPKLIVAHLGNGSSVTAIQDGKSMDTSMGLTPTAGVMMGTRCGDLDPGVLIYLQRERGMSAAELDDIVEHKSGLLGVSELSSDVRELMAAREQNAKADLALGMFAFQVRKAIAGMAAALAGVDAIVFSGGIGEHATEVRNDICSGLGFLGNVDIRVIPSQEDLQIARIVQRTVIG
ncbi:MAG: acetate/propionate family kinase [Acidobacteriaceae bacterium]|nr:acetate/propionate family kinase [Acidobacteriaceae bacterium]